MDNYKPLYHVVLIFLIQLILFSCSKNDDYFEQSTENKFAIEQAKDYFESTSSDLRLVGFLNKDLLTKSIDLNEKLVPLWNKSKFFSNNWSELYEVPIKDIIRKTAFVLSKEKDKDVKASLQVKLSTTLIIQKLKSTNAIRYFVVTILGEYNGESEKLENPFSYMGTRLNFKGYLIISDVSGRLIASYYYNHGSRLKVTLKSKSSIAEAIPESYHGFAFYTPNILTKGDGSYAFGCEQSGICTNCGFQGIVYINYGLCLNCIIVELDPIIVTPDPDPDPNPDEPQFYCPYCMQPYCNGECQNGGGSQGGGSQGGGTNTSVTKAQLITMINMTNLSQIEIDLIINIINNASEELLNLFQALFRSNMSISFQVTSSGPYAYIAMSINQILAKGNIVIHINSVIFDLSPDKQAIVIFHELIHAALHGIIGDAGSLNNLALLNPTLLSNLNIYGFEYGQHNYIALELRTLIMDLLSTITSVDINHDYASWASLIETDTFANLPIGLRNAIRNYLFSLGL